MIRLKQLDSTHLEKIVAFEKLNFPTDHWSAEERKEFLEDESALYYAFLDDENLVANIFIYCEPDSITILNIAVHPQYRRQGLACKLLDYVRDEMSNIGMKRFCGSTRSSNKAMQAVFEKCGYRFDRIEENYYLNPIESAHKYILQLD